MITWSCKVTGQIKYVISPPPQWLGSPNFAGWLHTVRTSSRTKSQDPLSMRPYKVTWKIEYIVSLLPEGLWSLNLGMCRVTIRASIHKRGTWQIKHVIFLLQQSLWPFDMARWWLTMSYFEGLKVSHKVTQPSKHMDFWDHVTNQKYFISTTIILKLPKLAACWSSVRASQPQSTMTI